MGLCRLAARTLSSRTRCASFHDDGAASTGTAAIATLELSFASRVGETAARFGASFADMPARDIAAQAPALAWLDVLRAPISGLVRDWMCALVLSALVAGCAPAAFEQANALERAAAVYDPDEFEATLAGLELWLRAEFPEVAEKLRPGLTDSEIDAMLADAGFAYALPAEVRQLYRWHDGMEAEGGLPLIWYHRFLSLEEALGGPGRFFFGIPDNALLLFEFPEEFYYVQCESSEVPALPVHFRLLEDPDERICFVSVQTMPATGREWYRNGAVEPDGEGWLTEDLERVAEIHGRLNPGLPFAYYVE